MNTTGNQNTALLEEILSEEILVKVLNKAVDKKNNKALIKAFTLPEGRRAIADAFINGRYSFEPAEIHYINKLTDQYLTYEQAAQRNFKEVRELNVSPQMDRIILSATNDVLFRKYKHLIHPACVSYQSGIGIPLIANKFKQQFTDIASKSKSKYLGCKIDISKYFDSVKIELIDKWLDFMFDKDCVVGKAVKEFYHNDHVVINKQLVERYSSLKQGCAIATILANLILRDIDEKISSIPDIVYYRYSDDIIIVGKNYKKAMLILDEELKKLSLNINEKKTEYIERNKWFTFLGVFHSSGLTSLGKENKIPERNNEENNEEINPEKKNGERVKKK